MVGEQRSFIIVGIATLIALPIGTLTGLYLALYGRGAFAESVRFLADVLSGVPSIAIGLFAYTLFVAPFKHFSAAAASVSFAILMLPLIIRTAEEAIARVPTRVREGALALGISSYSATMYIIVPAARPGIITGLLLAIARVTRETAPLLFTAFGSQFWELNPTNPMAELSLQVFTYAISPYDDIADISLSFPARSVTALIGPSGCGKSTLLRCLNRIHESSSTGTVRGDVPLDRKNIYDADVNAVVIRRRIGMVFQRANRSERCPSSTT